MQPRLKQLFDWNIMNMLFSIIVPVYNTREYLAECLGSILCQTYFNYEIIIVDDGSTDGSALICDEYANQSERIRVIHQQNGGLSAARNTGIKAAKGEYLLFVDSDDVLLTDDSLAKLATAINLYTPDMLMYLTKEYNEDLTSVVTTHTALAWEPSEINDLGSVINKIYADAGIYITAAPTKIAKRDYCLKNSLLFTQGIYHEDDEWIARFLLTSPRLAFCDFKGYGYRHRGDSIISTENNSIIQKKLYDRMEIAAKLLDNPQIQTYPNMHDYFVNYYINAYSQAIKSDIENASSLTPVPFEAFCHSKNKKIRLLGKIRNILGYRIAKYISKRYLMWKS